MKTARLQAERREALRGEQSGSAEAVCSGYVFHDAGVRKPPLSPSMSFGGSTFSALHRDFVASTAGARDLN